MMRDSKSAQKLRASASFVFIAVMVLQLLGCRSGGEPPAAPDYVFADRLGEAQRNPSDPKKISVGQIAIAAGDPPRRGILAHADSEIVFRSVPIPLRGHLKFGIGVNEAGWRQGGDGAVFTVSVRSGERREDVFSAHLDPHSTAADRGWVWADVDLQRYAGQSVDFGFRTHRGAAGSDDYDWCWWTDVVLEDRAAGASPARKRPEDPVTTAGSRESEKVAPVPETTQTYVFLDHLGRAERRPDEAGKIRAGEIAIRTGDRLQRAIFAHPNAEAIFQSVPIPPGAHLRFGIGITEQAWRQGGQGALFSVSARTKQGEELVFYRRLEPATVSSDRGWIWADVDLERYGSQIADLVFHTDHGVVGEGDYEWCWWANPVLESRADRVRPPSDLRLGAGETVPYAFLDNFERAERSTMDPERIGLGEMALRSGEVPEPALFTHADSAAVFPAVEIPIHGHLRFGIGIDEAGWRQGGDGSVFRVSVRTAEGEEVVFSRHLEPHTAAADRGWIWVDVDLARYAGRSVAVVFAATSGGASDEDYDWCWWADPVLIDYPASGFTEVPSLRAAAGRSVPPLVALISIDTLRADALSCYGNRRISTPNLDALAGDGVRFAHAIAQDSWTVPSHASLLASLYPTVSGVAAERPLPDGAQTLAEVLRARGFATVGIVNTQNLRHELGFDQGFSEYHEPFLEKGAAKTVAMALDAVQRFRGTPLFLFMHFFDVHGPYDEPDAAEAADPTPRRALDGEMSLVRRIHAHDYLFPGRYESLEQLHAAYESGIAPVDSELGRFFAELKRLGLYDDALLILVSDHGESFFEHRVHVGHGFLAYDTEVAVPMIFKLPRGRGAGTVVESVVGLVDVFPTIADEIGLPPLSTPEGRSLLPRVAAAIQGESPDADGLGAAAYGSISNTGYNAFVRTGRWKYIERVVYDPRDLVETGLKAELEVADLVRATLASGPELYDVAADPEERTNVIERYPKVAEKLRRMAAQQREREDIHRRRYHFGKSQRTAELSDAEREALRRLGYGE